MQGLLSRNPDYLSAVISHRMSVAGLATDNRFYRLIIDNSSATALDLGLDPIAS